MRVLLDNNAIADLFRSKQGPAARAAVRKLVAAGRYEILLTISQLTELTGLNDGRYALFVNEMLTLSRRRLLQAYPHRIRDELQRGRGLRRREAFYKRREAAPLFASLHDQTAVGKGRAHKDKVNSVFLQRETTARQKVKKWPRFKADWPKWKQRWDSDRDAVIEDWTADEIDRWVKEEKGPNASFDRTQGFDVRRIPTAWYSTAFHLARIRLLTDDKVGLRASDVWDREHFGDTAYADLMVTTDRGLSRIASETGIKTIRVLTFEQWAQELGRP